MLLPAGSFILVAKPERVMTLHDGPDRLFKAGETQATLRRQHHSQLPMVWVWRVLVEKPALNWRQKRWACYYILSDHGVSPHAGRRRQFGDRLMIKKLFWGQA